MLLLFHFPQLTLNLNTKAHHLMVFVRSSLSDDLMVPGKSTTLKLPEMSPGRKSSFFQYDVAIRYYLPVSYLCIHFEHFF